MTGQLSTEGEFTQQERETSCALEPGFGGTYVVEDPFPFFAPRGECARYAERNARAFCAPSRGAIVGAARRTRDVLNLPCLLSLPTPLEIN